jgi:transmembrane 9 superfamily protein 2/4
MLEDNGTCKTLCPTTEISEEETLFLNDRIREDYALNWLVDGLPAAELKKDSRSDEIFYDIGFNLGNDEGQFEKMPALHNHYDIELQLVFYLFMLRIMLI